MVKIPKSAGPKIGAAGKNGKADKRAKNGKIGNDWKTVKPARSPEWQMCENRPGRELIRMGNGETDKCDKWKIGKNGKAKRAPRNGKMLKSAALRIRKF